MDPRATLSTAAIPFLGDTAGSDGHLPADKVIEQLRDLSSHIKLDTPGQSKDQRELTTIAEKCSVLAEDLLAILEHVRALDEKTWQGFRVINWRGFPEREEIASIKDRLVKYGSEIGAWLLKILM
jgi:hypothetical protein